MPLEWSVTGLLLVAALWPLVRKARSRGARAVVFCLLLATVTAGTAWQMRAHNKLSARTQWQQKLPAETRPGGFVRSETCRSCHPDQYASWHGTYHRTMTQHATPEAVRGDFTNVMLTLGEQSYRLSRRGKEFWAEMPDPDWVYVRNLQQDAFERGQGPHPPDMALAPRVEKRITMTTGSHHMQAYWVDGAFGNQQFSFPFTWLFEENRWVPRNDVFLMPPDAPWKPQVWNDNCISCHSTAGQPAHDATSRVFKTRVAELGIACESCHGPGEQHVGLNAQPLRRYAMRNAKKGDDSIINPARLDHRKSSEACGQCHAARFNSDHAAWMAEGTEYWKHQQLASTRPLLPGQQLRGLNPGAGRQQAEVHQALIGYFWSDGMIRVSGREYNGLVDSPCYQRGTMSCLSCHSMHKMTSPADQLARGMGGNQACYQCHGDYEKKLTQHTRHAAGSSGSLCYNCHMPHTTYGLLKAIRSHQITSPEVKSSLTTGRPNACNLCHLDRSLDWTAQRLKEWYQQEAPALSPADQETPAAISWLLRGDAGQRALIAWHMGWNAAREASGTNWLAPYLIESLDDPYSAVRYIAQRSLKRLPGYEKLSYDYIAPRSQQTQIKSELLQRWNPAGLPETEQNKVLDPATMSRLLKQRNHRPVELLE